MRLPGFTAEQALGASKRSYRSRSGGHASGAGRAQPAVLPPRPRIRQPQTREVTTCTDCWGGSYECALNESCGKICTMDGQGVAWCQPK